MLRRSGAAAAVALCLLVPVSSAFASGADVLKDCASGNGRLSKTYTQKEYAQALKQMPTDLREYSDCDDIIRHAMLGLGGGAGTTPGATSQNPFGGASPQEVAQAQKDISDAKHRGATPQHVGGDVVTPGALAFRKVSAAVSDLPVPLLVVIVLVLLGTIGLGGLLYSNRERSGDPSP